MYIAHRPVASYLRTSSASAFEAVFAAAVQCHLPLCELNSQLPCLTRFTGESFVVSCCDGMTLKNGTFLGVQIEIPTTYGFRKSCCSKHA
jgi:hypothetical protein